MRAGRIFPISLLYTFCFKLVKDLGISVIVDLLNTWQQQLILYFATFSRGGRWIAIENVRTDLYEWEKAESDAERKQIMDKFHTVGTVPFFIR